MVTCLKCGKKLPNRAKFCDGCGERLSTRDLDYNECPKCGAIFSTDTSTCAYCGYKRQIKAEEENLKELRKLIEKIESTENSNTYDCGGFSSWSTAAKVWWIILNVCTIGVPVSIYCFVNAIRIFHVPKLSFEEEERVKYMEKLLLLDTEQAQKNVLEYIDSKLEILASRKLNSKTVHWAKCWKKKADQVYNEYDNSRIAAMTSSQHGAIEKNYNKIIRKARVNILISTIVMAVLVALFLIIGLSK